MSSAICFNLDQSKILSSGNGLNEHDDFDAFYTGKKPFLLFLQWFQPSQRQILSFCSSLNLLYSNWDINLSTALLPGKELTLSQMTNFRVFKTERVCRQQF